MQDNDWHSLTYLNAVDVYVYETKILLGTKDVKSDPQKINSVYFLQLLKHSVRVVT